MDNVRLSAPEAYLLLALPRCDRTKALKLGFMALVAQGALRIEVEDRRGVFRSRQIPYLRVGREPPQPPTPLAASLVEVVRRAEPGLMKKVLAQCQWKFGQTLTGITRNYLGPALVERGLAEPSQRRILGIFRVASFARTPAGEAEKARIEALIEDARAIPTYLDRDPVQAAALIAALGGAVLLVEELRPHYAALAAAMRTQDDGGSFGDGGSLSDGGSFDFGASDFGSIDFSCFDAGAFDCFDSGFSDAGGGDGGGGDGGSSGC